MLVNWKKMDGYECWTYLFSLTDKQDIELRVSGGRKDGKYKAKVWASPESYDSVFWYDAKLFDTLEEAKIWCIEAYNRKLDIRKKRSIFRSIKLYVLDLLDKCKWCIINKVDDLNNWLNRDKYKNLKR